MAKTVLVDKQIEDGKKLVTALEKANFDVRAALWFYFSEIDEWRLLIASSLFDSSGPIKAIRDVQRILEQIKPPLDLKLWEIAIISPKDNLIRLLRSAIKTSRTELGGIRFTRNVINNVFIEDAHIYRNA